MGAHPVYIEGFAATGERGQAQFMGMFSGKSFEDACERACEEFFSDYDPDLFSDSGPSYWGCRMFDNESDARRAYG